MRAMTIPTDGGAEDLDGLPASFVVWLVTGNKWLCGWIQQ